MRLMLMPLYPIQSRLNIHLQPFSTIPIGICLYPKNKIYLLSRNKPQTPTHHRNQYLVLGPLTHPIAYNPHKALMPPWRYSLLNLIVDIPKNQLLRIGLALIKIVHHWMKFQLLPQDQKTFCSRPHVLSQARPYINLQLGARPLVAQSSIMVCILSRIYFCMVLCHYAAATLQMSPVKNRATGKPLLVEPIIRVSMPDASIATLGSKWVCFKSYILLSVSRF
jgi:hypothetical protein